MKRTLKEFYEDVMPKVWAFLIMSIVTLGLVGGTVALLKWILRLFEVIT